MIKIKPITEHTWLVLADDESQKVGLLTENEQGFTLLAKEAKTHFDNKEEIVDFFKQDIFSNIVEVREEKEFFVKGYPVNFDKPHEVDSNDELTDLPLYAKTADSKVYHCAGYYCVLFPKGWVYGYCPKYSTIDKYEIKGPYKTEAEVKHQLSVLRKIDKRARSTS